jgi:hypothetical protein
MINGAKKVYYVGMEIKVGLNGKFGPDATCGRREWEVRKQIIDAFQSRKKQPSGTVKISDSKTNKVATDPNDLAQIMTEYADELYQTTGMDETMIDRIEQAPTPASVPHAVPAKKEIRTAIQHVKSRSARTDTPAEVWKALLMDPVRGTNMINILVRMIQEQYQGIFKSARLSNVSAKILNKPGKSNSGLVTNKRIIVLQPFFSRRPYDYILQYNYIQYSSQIPG